jgi:hypothetical protein
MSALGRKPTSLSDDITLTDAISRWETVGAERAWPAIPNDPQEFPRKRCVCFSPKKLYDSHEIHVFVRALRYNNNGYINSTGVMRSV